MTACEIFRKKLRQAREASGMTIPRLAEAIGVSSRTVSAYEAGESFPVLERLDSISKALGRPVPWFFTGDSDFVPEPRARIRQISTRIRELTTELAQAEKEL